ncbi:acyl carrier protein [Salinisphaera sp. SWV1]|uniref:acyl carrier protein n=1 Tax=Salinisphaera sp. SWV1 TaxID=3454139 RepID=UPI003F843A92
MPTGWPTMPRWPASSTGNRNWICRRAWPQPATGPALRPTTDQTMSNRYDEIYAHLNELLVPFVPAGTTIEPQTRLVDDLGLDSVQVMEVLMELEDRLDASIPMNFLPDVETMDDLVKAMNDSLAA